MSHFKPITPAQLERLRTVVNGPALCPSCGLEVHRSHDLCSHCDEEVSVEPISHEFFDTTPFVDRDTVCRLIALIDELSGTD